MGRFERQPDHLRKKGDPYGSAETAIKAVTEELQIIQRNVLKSLQEDVKRLQAEKDKLTDDIKQLQEKKGQLQQEFTPKEVDPNAAKHFGSLDAAVSITFDSLQQELKNYQSSLSQQLSRMHNQQQQGEVILAELVEVLKRELQTTKETPITTIQPAPSFDSEIPQPPQSYVETPTKLQLDVSPPQEAPQSVLATSSVSPITPTRETKLPPPPEPESVLTAPPPTVQEQTSPQQTTSRQPLSGQIGISSLQFIGIFLIVLSTVASSLYNVAIKVIFHPFSQIFGVFEVERLIEPNLGNALFILMLRMLVVVPLMMLLAPILHPRVWHDLQYLFDSVRRKSSHATARRTFILSSISGCFLFLSQLLIYLAIGQVPIGMAIALFFVYPIVSGLFSWVLFRDRLTLLGIGGIAAIGLGELLLLYGAISTAVSNSSLGSIAAMTSGIAFAFYVILSRVCAAKVHPVTFTLMNFATILLLSFSGWILSLPSHGVLQINPTNLLELVLSAFMLGVLTLCSYLLNNFGVRKIGASRSSIIGATVPAITVILAGLIIQETLQIEQLLGVLLVTFGSGTLSFERIRNRLKPSRSTY